MHGLRGDKIDTWRCNEVPGFVWPRDLLREDVSNARIITYGYDANVMNFFSSTSQSSIHQHAINLLEDLQRKRRTQGEVIQSLNTRWPHPALSANDSIIETAPYHIHWA